MSAAKFRLCAWVLGLLLATPAAMAQNGLRINDEMPAPQSAWPRWQARFGLGTANSVVGAGARWQLNAGGLVGDYYWSGLRPAGVGLTGGFRATSGLLLGQRSLALGVPLLTAPQSSGLTLAHNARPTTSVGDVTPDAWSLMPYVGVGYSGIALRSGWGFTADVGLAGTGGGLRARRDSAFGTQGMDDLVRELRLTPLLQFGASYAF